MGIFTQIAAVVICTGLLALLLWLVPEVIVENEWRIEQITGEISKMNSLKLKMLREEYIRRAQKAFNDSRYSRSEIADFLRIYMEQAQPYYEQYIRTDTFADINDNPTQTFTYPNALMLFVSYSLTTGYSNIKVRSVLGNAVLAVFSYTASILITIAIAAMVQLYSNLLRRLFAIIMRIDQSTKNPDRMSYKYMWDVAKRDGIVLVVTLFIACGAVVAGAAIMRADQTDWSWSMALLYAQAAAYTAGHTKYVPDPVEGNSCTVLYVMFMLALHLWMTSLLSLFFCSTITFVKSVYNTQWAEITDEQLNKLQRKVEKRKRQRYLDNPKYEA